MERKNTKFILWIIFAVLLVMATYGSFFIWKISQIENKISLLKEEPVSFTDTLKTIVSQKQINLKGIEKDRINILLLGIAGKGKPGQNLADTIIILSINPKIGKVSLLSIPRDLYVEIPNDKIYMKINSVYEYGLRNYPESSLKALEPIEKVVKNITSLDIDYWAIINFEGFEKAVDAVGGINIMNEWDIYDPRYPGPNYSYETFELKKGFYHLDGATALKYARMRHNDPEGDFGRAKRQQQVMQATKNKIFSTGIFLNIIAFNELLNTLGNNIKTNVSAGEIGEFLKLIKKLDTDNINNVVLDAWKKESLLKASHVFYGNVSAFVLVPRVGNWSEIQEMSQNIFDTNEIKRKRQEIEKENATIAIINKSGNAIVMNQLINLLKNSFDYKNVVVIHDLNQNLENETFIYDLTGNNKPFTLDELIKKLPAKNSANSKMSYEKSLGNVSADLILVVGKDLIPKYSMAEVSFKDYNEAED